MNNGRINAKRRPIIKIQTFDANANFFSYHCGHIGLSNKMN
jgi:hypothetical protein